MAHPEHGTTRELPYAVELDLSDINLAAAAELEDSALGKILRDVEAEASQPPQARHSSHSSYSSHGTAAW